MLEILLCPKSLATALALVCFSTQMSRVWTSRGFHGWDSPEVRSELELIERMRAQAFSIAMDGNSSAIWYFAYGANMASSVLARRSLAPLEVCSNVTVPDCKLSFDLLGVPYNEPALASLTAKTSTREFAVCGVAYLLSTADLSRLVTSEGGAVAYMVTKVVGVLPNRGPLNMITLVAKKPAARSRVPSKRYLGLLVAGARERDLPSTYQKYLARHPVFDPFPTTRYRVGKKLFDIVWLRVQYAIQKGIHRYRDHEGNAPSWFLMLFNALLWIMWTYHDLVHCHLFGRGDGL